MLRAAQKTSLLPIIYRHLSPTVIRPVGSEAFSKLSELQQCSNKWDDRRGFASSSRHRSNRRQGTEKSSIDRNSKNQQQADVFGTYKDAGLAIDDILARLSNLKIPQRQSLSSTIPPQKEEEDAMTAILNDTKVFFDRLTNSVQAKRFNPAGKHGKALSKLLELVLYVYCKLNLPNESLHKESTKVLETLKGWNLDLRSRHYEYAIAVAHHQQQWKDASDLFWDQISPGYHAVDVSISNPHGLYAIAKWAQEKNAAVVENVLDAVQQLSMVSPSDQPRYLLAAGTALGHAGEWESLIQYLNTSSNASQFGEALVASAMQTCLLSDRPNEALEVFESNVADQNYGLAREWQWGGESDEVDPLRRDLALRSMYARRDMSSNALQSFDEILEEGGPISLDALVGMCHACEQDGDDDGALQVLLTICKVTRKPSVIVADYDAFMDVIEGGSPKEQFGGTMNEERLPALGAILASTMRTSNAASKFGTSLFCVRLVSLHCESDGGEPASQMLDSTQPNLFDSLLQLIGKSNNLDELIVPTMVALCGLRCNDQAARLFELASERQGLRDDKAARLVYEAAMSEAETWSHVGNPWVNATKHIDTMTAVTHAVQLANRNLRVDEKLFFESILAAAMKACTEAQQPDLSLTLLWWASSALGSDNWMDKGSSNKGMTFETTNDAVLAERISAHRWNDESSHAVHLFEELLTSKSRELFQWRLSCNAGLSALVAEGRGKDAWDTFQNMDPAALTTESYPIVGQFLAKTNDWNALADLYRSAVEQGHLSDELSLLTMKAMVFSKVDNRLRVLRSIVRDSANIVGLDPIRWTNSRYWHVKRAIGFNYARLLMWWNDPDTCEVDELNFAIQNFRQRRENGLAAKNDVVRTIVKAARSFNYDLLQRDGGNWQHVPSSTAEWKSLFRQVLEETGTSSILYDTKFVDDLVEACLQLGCTRECTELAEILLDRGYRVNRKSLLGALDAAKVEESRDLANDIMMVLGDGESTR